jgi:hypothetical protein
MLDMFGEGSKLIAKTEAPQEVEEAPQEAAPEEIEAPEEEPEAVEPQEAEATEAEEPTPDMFAALAAAYIAKKTVPAPKKPEKAEEPEEVQEEAEEEPEKTAPGYTGAASDRLTAEEITAVLNGEQVKKSGQSHLTIYTATRYNDQTAFVYSQTQYIYRDEPKPETVAPGKDFSFDGFINGGKYYTDTKSIAEELQADVESALQKAIPTEEAAKENAAYMETWEAERINDLLGCDFTSDAQSRFYRNEQPKLTLYRTRRREPELSDIIRYIENPAEVVNRYRDSYKESCKYEIYCAFIRYNRTADAYREIIENKQNEAHTIKRIAESIHDEKTAKIKLKNGETVKVEAFSIKGITYSGTISEYQVASQDREKLPKDERGRAQDIKASDIVAIYHGQRTLYSA